MNDDIREIIDLGNRIEEQVDRLNAMIQCNELREHLDIFLKEINENIRNIKEIKELTNA